MDKAQQPRLSASVILFREPEENSREFEIFLLKRTDTGGFMPGRFVFPGGALERSDGTGEAGLMNCAIRELWEEAGVALLRDNGQGQPPGQETLEAGRKKLEERAGLAAALKETGGEAAPELLVPFARWITPTARPKRFDTVFYLALLPQGQEPSADQQETSEGVWLTPAQALEENRSGRVGLAAPQVRILGELSALASRRELFSKCAAQDRLEPVKPVIWSGENKERVILLPWDRDHGAGRPDSPAKPCPASECTRLIHDSGRWRPYACLED